MKAERTARIFILGIILGLPLAILVARWLQPARAGGVSVEIHGTMAEEGGWTPANLTVSAGEPLHLRLTSDDVMHGFAIGQDSRGALDVKPGQVTETILVFDQPGKYTFYCTRWCGPNHWRMRGTIEVTGQATAIAGDDPPLYAQLSLDIDAPHPAAVLPGRIPAAERGTSLGLPIPEEYLGPESYRSRAPAETWQALRDDPFTRDLSDEQVWDLVALVWQSQTTPESLAEGRELYAQNCAACHGESGQGDGVMADSIVELQSTDLQTHGSTGHEPKKPVDFTRAGDLLGASPALLQGKILRGGMGTGMPYFGPIFTDEQTWALVDYLYSFYYEE
jgi:mono/diheme cytochrome c family protein/plastocyanin